MEELWTMSKKELDRAGALARVVERRLSQERAATLLGVSTRQVRRLLRAYQAQGAPGLVSKRRGKPSNRQFAHGFKERVLSLVRERYADFGPTLAQEKLREDHGVVVSAETLRKWMAEEGLWLARKERLRVQQPRLRRARHGELIQIDGSDHEWFEDRAPRCVLLVFVDDATGKLMELRFCRSESTFEYWTSVRRYLERYGRPVAFYSDKATVFRVNRKLDHGGTGVTQFGRAMRELNIDVICANTPAAKGRVERAHLTLQDRLVKEMRLAGVSSMEDGNLFLEGFRDRYNQRFGRSARDSGDMHRPLLPEHRLDEIFQEHREAKVSKNLTLHCRRTMYVLENCAANQPIAGKRVQVLEDESGQVTIFFQGRALRYRAFPKHGGAGVTPGDIVANKYLAGALTVIREQQQQREVDRIAKLRTLRQRAIATRA
jgi:transposase